MIDSFLELREGDYVVHLAHGIGRYRGLKLLEKHEQVEEHLELEFHGGTKIYVPASNIELVQKYVGGSKAKPALAHIGGRLWAKQKEAAEAGRDRSGGRHAAIASGAVVAARHPLSRPTPPGSRNSTPRFPIAKRPTSSRPSPPSSTTCTIERPMDRLLCGDVGYGKTEVAMRAAFKAVDAGYQVAVLVPTTILCEQHRRTFTERMAEFPFQIAALSRFCTARQQSRDHRRPENRLGRHRHRHASAGAGTTCTFANLGLVIIDEEQRFGVEVKERLKTLRQTIDVLTLTATPIPRTLAHVAAWACATSRISKRRRKIAWPSKRASPGSTNR